MKAFFNDIKKVFVENKKMAMCGALLTLTLVVYFISWHFTIITFGSIYSVLDVGDLFIRRANYYLLESFLFASAACIVMITVRKPLIKRIFIGLFLAVFAVSEIIRMVDWGALYFMGNHIDSNFWAHAFYADGLVFLIAKESLALYVTVGLFFAAVHRILKKMYLISNAEN
ncbi:MAG TPA: hypothetical protein PLM53_07845 [Spirochaetota bacterium]|nr:hypothetical protein [Spirochaetota bacterium]HPC41269.1 hypothetical protein [Spirochaetota bacterium]HPL15692.1 hypothetical protein [Spirochaetota bacterium]HQF08119.1 hypothetical protein [Spirochaetota bacterium]HQH96994.1 hypothetical protein [Spirochaetota bacterium]